MCCLDCLDRKTQWIKQAFYVKLIKLKAATMSRRCGRAELEWRYDTWKKQLSKELVRIQRSYHYDPVADEDLGNIDEDEYDEGWRFPLPQEEVEEQLRDINERVEEYHEYPEYGFWLDGPGRHEEAGFPLAEDITESEVEATDEEDQEMTEEGEGGEESGGDSEESDEGMTGTNEITDADRAAALGLLDLRLNSDRRRQELAASRSAADGNAFERAGEQANDENEDPAPHPLESATTPTRAESAPNSEGPASTHGTPRGHDSHESLHGLFVFEEPESNDQADSGDEVLAALRRDGLLYETDLFEELGSSGNFLDDFD